MSSSSKRARSVSEGAEPKKGAKSSSSSKIVIEPQRAALPKRKADRTLNFGPGFADFLPNLTPEEVLSEGAFGGTYFRSISSSVTGQSYTWKQAWEEFQKEGWLKNLSEEELYNKVGRPWDRYDQKLNLNREKCGQTLDQWQEAGWIMECDPYGWFQWYCRFYLGRRCSDDERQITRWQNTAAIGRGRWRTTLVNKIESEDKVGDLRISGKIRQILQHFGYTLTLEDYRYTKEDQTLKKAAAAMKKSTAVSRKK
ncbi:unnamed protein product [Polarella glacialis]|uniref:Uncharacterized protein n=1 Tax=Polarella glacialis TaxID=89957 RepID=A0A813F737_POLGL|nr:unnamed protein product [Polarella glacialis]